MRQNPSSLSRIPVSGLPRSNVDAICDLRPVFRPLTRFPFFPVETGNFVDFTHSTVVGPEKDEANQSLRANSRRSAKRESPPAQPGARCAEPGITGIDRENHPVEIT